MTRRYKQAIRHIVNGNHIHDVVAIAWKEAESAKTSNVHYCSGCRHDVSPPLEGLLVGASNDGGPVDDELDSFLVLIEVLFSHVLGEGVCIWKVANYVLLFLGHLINAHAHDLSSDFLHLLLGVVNLFLDVAVHVAVDVGRRHVAERLEHLALLGQSQDPTRSEVVDLKGFLQRIIKVNRGCTVDYHLGVLDDQSPLVGRDPQLLLDQVALDGDDLRHGELQELLLPAELLH
mmetsp:Transcript_2508/g.3883  ORF Transcript_2508/g.3883 Transcript_2508/m.3883 type:complete len:232 (+) Transcript_2508:261-956(+)